MLNETNRPVAKAMTASQRGAMRSKPAAKPKTKSRKSYSGEAFGAFLGAAP